MILFNEFKREYDLIRPEIECAIKRVLDSGWYILGTEGESFEREFAAYLGCRYCVGVANGTEAIALGLKAMGIGVGDEVITTNMTAFPTITGILQAGATPVVVDICVEDGLMDCNRIEEKISSRTKAIVPVHLYGQCCDLKMIKALAEKYRLRVMEDCAQAAGAEYASRKAGNWGDCAAFSFYPTKNLGAYGDAGAVVTQDAEIYERLKVLRNYGQTKRYYHDLEGINSRLDELQAAVLRVKLKYLDQWNYRRREIAAKYRAGLPKGLCLVEHEYGKMNYHLFVIKSSQRDKLASWLEQQGVKTLIHYPVPIHRQKAFPGQKEEMMPQTQLFAASILSLPMYPSLTDGETDQVVEIVNQFFEK